MVPVACSAVISCFVSNDLLPDDDIVMSKHVGVF